MQLEYDQDCSQSFSLYCEKPIKPSGGFIGSIYLLNDPTLEFKSNFPLKQYEFSSSIISCSFSGDNNVYYCVGTGYMDEYGGVIEKGRVLVLSVQDGVLTLVAQMKMKNYVGSLNTFQGKLLVMIQKKIKLYRWMLGGGGNYELQFECENCGMLTSLYVYVETRGNVIVVGGTMNETLSVLIYKPEKSAIEELDRYHANWSTTIKILDDDLYLGGDAQSYIFTVCKSEGASYQEELWEVLRCSCVYLFAYPVFRFVDISLFIMVTLLSLRSRMPILCLSCSPKHPEKLSLP